MWCLQLCDNRKKGNFIFSQKKKIKVEKVLKKVKPPILLGGGKKLLQRLWYKYL